MLNGSAANAALESKLPGEAEECYSPVMFFGHESHDCVAENALTAAVPPSTAGSFDCVRLRLTPLRMTILKKGST
jgi:hypothetical protein